MNRKETLLYILMLIQEEHEYSVVDGWIKVENPKFQEDNGEDRYIVWEIIPLQED